MSDPGLPRSVYDLPPGVQRIVVWCTRGCVLIRDNGRWLLERPADMTGSRGPAPKVIRDATAQAAIAAGARVGKRPDLFGDVELARAA